MQATTGQYVVCKYCTSCSQQYFMLDLHPDSTKNNLPIRRGFGPTIDVMITSWCTGCWSNVVVSGVYRSTSARSNSRKHLAESSTQHYGTICSSLVSSLLTWDYYNGFTASKRVPFWLTKKATHFQSNGERSMENHYPLYYSTRSCNTHWRMIWNNGRRIEKGFRLSDKTDDCLTNLRFADDVIFFSTSLEKLREMLCEFKTSTEAVGLGIHPDKTKILSNQDKIKTKEITVDNI